MASYDELFEPDIVARVRSDFGDESEIVLQQLLGFCKDHAEVAEFRIVRCIIHAAQGRLSGIAHYTQMAISDYRDLIMCAEYQTQLGTKRWQGIYDRIYDFNHPFPSEC